MKKIKFTLITTLIIAIVFGVVFTFSGHAIMKATSGDKFCVSCHSWMDPMVQAYKGDVHGGSGHLGAKAECTSCHLPHENLYVYVKQKAINGLVEGWHTLFNDPKEFDWIENRKRREEYVFDSGCMQCHGNILDTPSKNIEISKMHDLYKTHLNTDKQIQCVTCHTNVGHKNLGETLYEIKNPPIGDWTQEELVR